ncbi:hypothetical protein [Paenibacillus sp. WLX2291]|uniref:hypothetical protein n=1 Tax=Paenibacillus sp. WLX2291 TaxID=3296934 RepID=UPI00398432D0
MFSAIYRIWTTPISSPILKWFGILILLLISLSPLYTAKPAYACSCAQTLDVAGKMKYADTVFAGQMTDVRQTISASEHQPLLYTFKVKQAWTDNVHEQTSVVTSGESSACGYVFEKEKSYLVYAHTQQGELKTDLCIGNAVYTTADAQSDLAQLGDPRPVLPGSNHVLVGQRLRLVIALGIVVSLVVWIWLYRRRHHRRVS